jgi:hypothetical protein
LKTVKKSERTLIILVPVKPGVKVILIRQPRTG